ncbi:MAG TPA: restriction endonuclease subunit S [Planctomycetota bacterium]
MIQTPESDLPEGWTNTTVADVISDIQPGFASGQKDVENGLSHLRMNNIGEEGNLVLDLVRTVPHSLARPQHQLLHGDVLVCTTNSGKLVGKCALFNLEGVFAFSNHLTRLRPNALLVLPDLLRWSLWLTWRLGVYEESCRNWVNQSSLPKEALLAATVALPPLAEQERILAQIVRTFPKVNSARERLAKVPKILKRFRQAVLAAACSGRLTADWREQHPDVEPASQLLARILKERRANWEAHQLAKFKSSGKLPKDDKWKSKYEEPAAPDTSDLPELPETWTWVPLGWLGEDPLNAVQTGPFGAQLHNDEFVASGVPVIAVGNLTGMGFTDSGLYFITSAKAGQLARYDVNAGDVLFARSGATLGKVCAAPAHVKDWRMTGHILRARLKRHAVLPEVAVYALRGAPAVLDQVTGRIRGITRPGYNTSLLETILLPLPPLAEQHEIVRRVEAMFKLADQIENRVAAGTARADKLTQAILAKAFRGELVPTEAELARREGRHYEPASVLLERIKVGRDARVGAGGG